MARLAVTPPALPPLPEIAGGTRLSAPDHGRLTLIAPRRGAKDATSEALKAAHGMAFPAACRATGRGKARCLWWGHGPQAMLIGPAPDRRLAAHAGLTDQSDGWAALHLDGPAARDVLARVTTIDLRPTAFRRGRVARTGLREMPAALWRSGEDRYELFVMRSMAGSAAEDVLGALRAVAARRAAGG